MTEPLSGLLEKCRLKTPSKNKDREVFEHDFQKFVYKRTYSRWMDDEGRREHWPETVVRFMSFLEDELGHKVPRRVLKNIERQVYKLDTLPSMRLLWSAGEAARKDNVSAYNCAFTKVSSIHDFAEILYILMCGAGVGFSVPKEDVDKLPTIPSQITTKLLPEYQVGDNKAGWADSVFYLLSSLYAGADPVIKYDNIRPAGARLKTMGGRASGPEPLMHLHDFIRSVFYEARGRKLKPIEVHDIVCKIAEIVVVGGVRRSSLISLSDFSDEDMRQAKTGSFPVVRYMANNSAIYDSKPTYEQFVQEWDNLRNSGSGERGIYNRHAARLMAPERRDDSLIAGTNPCAEISLRNHQFCNLSEVVARPDDTVRSLVKKVKTAVWLGAMQSTFTYFPYLREEWKQNCEEERLLGVSITGQYDAPHLMTAEVLGKLKKVAQRTAKKASKALGINMPAAITCTKPSGTVSQLVNSASGMHPRYAQYYIRRYRISATDPLFKMMQWLGIHLDPENGEGPAAWQEAASEYHHSGSIESARRICSKYEPGQSWSPDKVKTWVVSFPVKSPDDAITVDEVSAIDQLEWYKKVQDNWCEHNASVTVYVKDHEWDEVRDWVYNNWEYVLGISFLPYFGGVYSQAPYEQISQEEYEKVQANTLPIRYEYLSRFEKDDNTEGAKTYACVSGACEI